MDSDQDADDWFFSGHFYGGSGQYKGHEGDFHPALGGDKEAATRQRADRGSVEFRDKSGAKSTRVSDLEAVNFWIKFCFWGFRGQNVVKKVLQCCALNGGIFFLSIAFFDGILMPAIRSSIVKMYSNPELSSLVWRWIEPTLIGIFSLIWIMPLFLLSRIVNALWFAVS